MTGSAKVRLHHLVSEPGTAGGLLASWLHTPTETLLDGPVSRRLAVIDFDPDTGAVVPGAKLVKVGRRLPAYKFNHGKPHSPSFQQVTVFTTVMKVMAMFEEDDVLGRQLNWAFEGEQLLIVPRAGRKANAFYHRDSRSLQFFFFDGSINGVEQRVYTCLSPDIIAHEATHAILDGIAPDLYDAASPQSSAIHEAVADIGAVLFALRTRALKERVFERTGGDLRQSGAFSDIARQFGEANGDTGRPLRDLYSATTLAPGGPSPASDAPHDLSVVLSSALYSILVCEYEMDRLERSRENTGQDTPSDEALYDAAGLSLFVAGEKLKRIALRALDYLPPGEVSFADYGRAMVAADRDTNPTDPHSRALILDEFVRRGIVANGRELEADPPDMDLSREVDLDLIARSDWAAYQFADRFRAALMIPENTPYEVRPRLRVVKKTYRADEGAAWTVLYIFKVTWRTLDEIAGTGFVRTVSVARGTTLVIDAKTRRVMTLLSTATGDGTQTGETAARDGAMRMHFVAHGLSSGVINLADPNVEVQDGTLFMRATGQRLHMAGGEP